MNSTQYLIILITAVVGFCIYVLAEIVRLREEIGNINTERQAMWSNRKYPMTEMGWKQGVGFYTRVDSIEAQRLQEEIRTRLEGGDGA